jgi:tRNA (guanine37-N1)-methyltransferase
MMTSEPRTWTARVLTIFPEIFPGPLAASLAGQGLPLASRWKRWTFDLRDKRIRRRRIGGGRDGDMRPDVVMPRSRRPRLRVLR